MPPVSTSARPAAEAATDHDHTGHRAERRAGADDSEENAGMVFIWGTGGNRRRGGWGGPGFGRGGYGYGPPPGYGGYRRGYGGGGGGGCLRDLLLLNTGCCLAESLGCGLDLMLVAPTTARRVRAAGDGGGRVRDRLVAAVRVYQREVSPRRGPCCHFTPTCSEYAVQALEGHGARRGSWLTMRRLLRCRPGAAGGADPVPAAG